VRRIFIVENKSEFDFIAKVYPPCEVIINQIKAGVEVAIIEQSHPVVQQVIREWRRQKLPSPDFALIDGEELLYILLDNYRLARGFEWHRDKLEIEKIREKFEALWAEAIRSDMTQQLRERWVLTSDLEW